MIACLQKLVKSLLRRPTKYLLATLYVWTQVIAATTFFHVSRGFYKKMGILK